MQFSLSMTRSPGQRGHTLLRARLNLSVRLFLTRGAWRLGGLAAGLLAAVLSAAPKHPPQIAKAFPVPGEKRAPDWSLDQPVPNAVSLLAFDAAGRRLAAAGADKFIRVWNAEIDAPRFGQLLYTLESGAPEVTALAFSADGRALVALGSDARVSIWSAARGDLLQRTTTDANPRTSLFVPGNQPLLAEATGEGVRLWNYATGKIVREFSHRGEHIRTLALAPDGRTLLAANRSGVLRVWQTETGELVRSIDSHVPVTMLAASASRLAAGGGHGGAIVWPASGGEPQNFGGSAPLALSPQGDRIAAVDNFSIGVWDLAQAAPLAALEGHTADVVAVTFDPRGEKIASSDAAGNVSLWSAPPALLAPERVRQIAAAAPPTSAVAPPRAHRVLVFWRDADPEHREAILAANHAIAQMGKTTGAFAADFTRDLAVFDRKTLADYDAIVLNNPTRLPLSSAARAALLDYVRGGHGLVALHGALAAFGNWPDGMAMLGANGLRELANPAGSLTLLLPPAGNPLTEMWQSDSLALSGESAEFAPVALTEARVLFTASMDASGPGAAPVMPANQPVSWTNHLGAGRIFYCGLGHTPGIFADPRMQRHCLAGIQYVLGDLALPDDGERPAQPRPPRGR
ncbi:MAG TPA: ThuA domain-containing protein [Opitutaceae bacterium]|nr:ThuA domain-containing protein [Opitutaceae bacterium]